MKRDFWQVLVEWKNQSGRKPLLIQGARQVGKTWILREFGHREFERLVLLDFAADKNLAGFFSRDLKPDRMLTDLSVYFGQSIDPANTLLVLDEIQRCPEALTSLKYFQEQYPAAWICASGSLLGLGLSEQDFPVGKVQRAWLRPMSFFEFLEALDETLLRDRLLESGIQRIAIAPPVHTKAFDLFKEFMITGGLPEVVDRYRRMRHDRPAAFRAARILQKELVDSYLDDIAKHAGKLSAVKIAALFNNIPVQLARETSGVRKFFFKDAVPGASTYAGLDGPLEWLARAGLIYRVPICRTVRQPLKAYAEPHAFMLYLFDVGVLGAMLDLDPEVIHRYDFGQFKGFMAENMVIHELVCAGHDALFTWRGKTAEIEFLIQVGGDIIPVEVKSGLNTKAKSMNVYRERYQPASAVLLSGVGANQVDHGLLHAPLYLAGNCGFGGG
jgi:uncharacterized protein